MATYGLFGAEPEEPSERTKRIWRRGRQMGAAVADDFATKHGEENVIREKAVEWPNHTLPLGELHTDVYVLPDRMAVEVKSSTSPASILDDAITQLGGEIFYDEDADIGCLAIADPSGWSDTQYLPVVLTDELQERVESIAQEVVDASRTGTLPNRVCGKPSDGHGKFCPFINVCFDGWQPPDPLHLPGDAALIALRLKAVQDLEREARSIAKTHEEERKQLSVDLAGFDLVPGLEYSGAGARVIRTHVAATEKLSLTTLKKAGMLTPELELVLRPFIKASGEHDRWKIEPDDSVPTDEDFGSVPWDDDGEGTFG